MKKNFNLYYLLFVILLIPLNIVNAGGSSDDTPTGEKMATCTYSIPFGDKKINFDISIYDSGSVDKPDVGSITSNNRYYSFAKNFNEDYFSRIYNNGKLSAYCPAVYVCDNAEQYDIRNKPYSCASSYTSASEVGGTLTYKSSNVEKVEKEKEVYCSKTIKIRNSSSYKANFTFFKDVDDKNKVTVSKVYTRDNSKDVIGTVTTDLPIGFDEFTIVFGNGVDSFFSKNTCSSTPLYLQTKDGMLYTVQTNKPDDFENGAIGIGDAGKEDGQAENEVITTTTKKSTPSTNYDTNCPLGEDVTKDVYGLLKIIKIIAPLLVIALTIFEGVISLTKGDIQSDMKKLYMRLIKRVIYAVILFFLPVLVNQIMIMADVWDANGTCDFSNSVEYNNESENGD